MSMHPYVNPESKALSDEQLCGARSPAVALFLDVDNVGIGIDLEFLLRNRLLDGVLGVEDVVEFLELLAFG